MPLTGQAPIWPKMRSTNGDYLVILYLEITDDRKSWNNLGSIRQLFRIILLFKSKRGQNGRKEYSRSAFMVFSMPHGMKRSDNFGYNVVGLVCPFGLHYVL